MNKKKQEIQEITHSKSQGLTKKFAFDMLIVNQHFGRSFYLLMNMDNKTKIKEKVDENETLQQEVKT